MTREEAIKRLEWLEMVSTYVDSVTIGSKCTEDWEAYRMAVAALKQQPPCKIGDEVFGIKRSWRPSVLKRKVTQIFYSDDMELCAVVENVCRGKFGETVFLTREEAEEALRKMEEA